MKTKTHLFIALIALAAFAIWTAAVCTIDMQAVGPNGSKVGFATLNSYFHNLTGVHMNLYVVTDWMGLVPVAFALGFAVLGLVQWVCRKNIVRVDDSILVLGGFYILVIATYLLFEMYVVNYRPILIDGFLEASYPSSTTLLVLCVMPSAMMQLHWRIRAMWFRRCLLFAFVTFMVFMLLGRLISGVHWVTDIVGGALLSAGLVELYFYLAALTNCKNRIK